MSSAPSPANMLHQMARLADELESQGAEIIGASGVRVCWLVPRETSDGLDAAIGEAMEKENSND